MNTDPTTPFAMSVAEAVQYSRIGRSKLYHAMRDGELVARKFGARTVILRADLEAFLTSRPAYAPRSAAA